MGKRRCGPYLAVELALFLSVFHMVRYNTSLASNF